MANDDITSKVFLRELLRSFSNFERTEPTPTAEALKVAIAFLRASSCASLKESCKKSTNQ
jgi:hypothetical protein